MEEWKLISEFPEYEVSNLGRVRSLTRQIVISASHDGRRAYTRRQEGRFLALRPAPNGYILAKFPNATRLVNRLVCEAFHGPAPDSDHEAHHSNFIRSDNRDTNLQWLPLADNRLLRNIAKGERAGSSKLTSIQVQAIFAKSQNVKSATASDRALASQYGVTRETIRNIRLGATWRHLTSPDEIST